MSIRRLVVGVLPVALMTLSAGWVSGQDYPNKPIRIVTASVGSGTDFTARQIAPGISGPRGQQVIVENRGSGLVQGEFLSKAPADGYGLVVTGGTFWIFPLLQKVPYDVANDFSPVSVISREVNLVVVHP